MPAIRTLLTLAASLTLRALAQQPDTLLQTIAAPSGGAQEGAQLGTSVAIDGALTVVGAPLDDIGATDAGVVKVFDTHTGLLLHLIRNPIPAIGDNFGSSVAISGTRVVVGARNDNPISFDEGSAYVYDLSSPTPTVPVVTLSKPGAAIGDYFGHAVGISGTRVVVGASSDNVGGSDAGRAYVYDVGTATPEVPVFVLNNPSPEGFDMFGVAVAISGTRVVVGASGDDTGGIDRGSAYVYDLSSGVPTVPVVTLNSPFSSFGGAFGNAVAISGVRVVVGVAWSNNVAIHAGRACVYDLSSGTPTVPVAVLNNPSPVENDEFGYAVAISGTRVVVGAPYDDTFTNNDGSAYVYELTSPTPTLPIATLNNPGLASGDNFGAAVSLSGTHVAVGAPLSDTAAPNAGSSYVYDFGNGAPTTPVASINAPGPAVVTPFGRSVDIAGMRMVVGAFEDDTGASNAGSAYVYDLGSGMPASVVLQFNNPSPASGDNFGFAVAISGTRVVVGARNDDTGASDAGSAYVYDLRGPSPAVPVITLNNPSPTTSDNFGQAVAISGTRVVVGAHGDDTGASNAGSAYVYDLASANPTVPVATLNNPGPGVDDFFGFSVAIDGQRVVVGAHFDDTGVSNAGSAYVYDLGSATPEVPIVTLNNPAAEITDEFGLGVAIHGNRVVVGAPLDDATGPNAGSAYVYDLAGLTPTVPELTLNNPTPAAFDRFGFAVAISGTRVLVGAYGDDAGATDAGGAYVYELSSAMPTVPVATLTNPSPASGENFGICVALDGTTAAIGTPFESSAEYTVGAAYVFAPADHDFDDDGLLDLWEYARFGSTGAHDADDDSDGDGRVELLEQAFDRNPLAPDVAAFPQVVNEGGYLTLTLAKRAGVTYLGQSAASPEATAFSAMTTTVLVNDAATLKVRDNFPISTGGQRFLRVQVTAAP